MNNTSNKITADHLARRAYVYIRQSTPDQVKPELCALARARLSAGG